MRTLLVSSWLVGCVIPADRELDRQVLELEVTTEEAIDLVTRAGDLEVIGEPGRTTVQMEVTLVRFTDGPFSPSDAAGLNNLVATLESEGGQISAEAFVSIVGNNPFGTDVVLRVPADLDVAIEDDSGDIAVSELAGTVSIDDDSGDIVVAVVGAADINDDSGAIELLDVDGDVTINDDSGFVFVQNVMGTVDIIDQSGDIEVNGAGTTTIRDDSGAILVTTIEGDVDVVDDSGDIDVRDVTGVVSIDDDSGDIRVTNVGDFELRSDGSGSVTVN
ncbi:MAG: hypothetical protein AAGA48_34010 [Myxococcota bacterium]